MSQVLNNVVFAYVKIQSPVKKYQSADTEFTVDCIVTKAQAKQWNKDFPKQKAKEVDNADFKTQFKIDVPFPEQEEQYVIKLKKAHIKDGKELDQRYRPRVFKAVEGGLPLDVTFTTLPANGSKGKVEYNVMSNDYGTFASLLSILVEDMIEYNSGVTVGGAFGVTQLDAAPPARVVERQGEDDAGEAEEASTPAPKAKPKAAAKAPVEGSEEDEDSSPF